MTLLAYVHDVVLCLLLQASQQQSGYVDYILNILQVSDYVSAATAVAASGSPTAAQVASIKSTLESLFESSVNVNLGTRLTDVSNILQALSDLSALHTNSLASPKGSLQILVDNLTA